MTKPSGGARIEVWPVQPRGDRDAEWRVLLVDRNDRPLALLTREDLLGEHASGYIDTEAAASDMIDWCGADILSKPEGIQRWAKHWRETRIVNGELLGECPSCGAMADACSPEGQFCEDEGCWEEGDDEG